jgi:hypothetical protein
MTALTRITSRISTSSTGGLLANNVDRKRVRSELHAGDDAVPCRESVSERDDRARLF